jgi:hypothetical protein
MASSSTHPPSPSTSSPSSTPSEPHLLQTPNPKTQNLTTYKVLNRNFRTDFPEPSLEIQILRVCKKIKEEAEPVLYGNPGTEWDFGIYLEAVDPFFGDQSEVARGFVRRVKVAREIRDGAAPGTTNYAWEKFCKYIDTEFRV